MPSEVFQEVFTFIVPSVWWGAAGSEGWRGQEGRGGAKVYGHE